MVQGSADIALNARRSRQVTACEDDAADSYQGERDGEDG
jgi:hypothetical protein